ncbi:GNAT family N-acetyltransferase [Gordonia sp. TBRC 11910]|uniref:GNAT family N-acetyltransferase n=1 Tax=Gordonia asplenii TaxID=2725283 RepID=A0A848KSD6_9ACTN|nr:GNAT family N-acetyltransferase [Gordonia asplenii]NMN99784.1 GNAT family N-acetyltransferase [Gordonia asplenii]
MSVLRALDADPVGTAMVAARVEAHGVEPRSLGGQLWSAGDVTTSLCFSGANLIPLRGSSSDMHYFADRALSAPRACSSIVGHAEYIEPLWATLEPTWGPAREVRDNQPLMALQHDLLVTPDPHVRMVTFDDLDSYLPAAVEMFIGEVGVDPCAGDGGRAYRRRLESLVSAHRVFARFDGRDVVFKAEIGSLSRRVGQIQGVWVDPDLRGHGYGVGGTAAVAQAILDNGRLPSLYVNDFNGRARNVYNSVGFSQVGTFATVLID